MIQANGKNANKHKEDTSLPIRLLKPEVRDGICAHLDKLNASLQLATFVKLNPSDVEDIRKHQNRGGSPTSKFLEIWGGQYNHTVYNLFALFHKLKLYSAMGLIKDYVDQRYHKFILKTPIKEAASKINNGPAIESSTRANESEDDIRISSVQRAAESLPEIAYDELTAATDNWNIKNRLGQGGFGEVYKGVWKKMDSAIKVMNYRRDIGDKNQIDLQQSINELKFLNSKRHDNILPLYGYSINGEKPCIVYQLMKGGSLEARLRVHKVMPLQYSPLTWKERFNIAFGTAKGIYFLHTASITPVIHGDIKPANILLDINLEPKIGDFGLAREGPTSNQPFIQLKKLVGTRVYLPPEFLRSKQLSTGVDIYSFGIVLLEIFTGHLITDRTVENHPIDLLQLVKQSWSSQPDRRILAVIDEHLLHPVGEDLEKFMCAIRTGLNCSAEIPHHRPSMEAVVNQFETYYK